MKEQEFIDWIRSQSRFDRVKVPVGPGDDCAVVAFAADELIVTTDQVLDGVHFILADHGPTAAGRKAMARNLSDIAAMAAVPVAATATVALPRGIRREDVEAIYNGLRSVADQFDCPLVGGDVGAWDGALAISVTAFGRAGQTKPILRCGALAGDAICVTGSLGGAWRGNRHLEFTPRIAEARTLASSFDLHAMIDISDGLATDLGHLCEASGLGAEIESAAIPIHPEVAGLDDPLAAAISDGEDYELVFTLPADQAKRLTGDQALPVKITQIGIMIETSGIVLIDPDGGREPMKATGWEHQT